tara:strand:- start:766 stop:1713 length:948 start_codon:yes stop_codon:yes gene_type:complete
MNDELKNNDIIEYIISEESKGLRVDQGIAKENKQFSRSLIQKWIKNGNIKINNDNIKAKHILEKNDKVTIIPEKNINFEYIEPQDIKVDIAYEDNDLIIINKKNNIICHPAAGHRKDTIANGLVYLFPELKNLPRSGLIHRLDKDTTGLLIVARTIDSYTALTRSMQNRSISRHYIAFCHGLVMKNGKVEQPMSRHRTDRKKMAVNINGKEAITEYEAIKNYKKNTKLRLKLHTGRTHQIRVHMQYIGFPLIGDQTYGLNIKSKSNIDNKIKLFSRQALHAESLSFSHPITSEKINIKSILPNDLICLEKELENV